MPNVNDLVRELLRTQANYAELDAENNRLREIEKAAEEFCAVQRRGYASPHQVFALIARLDGAVSRNEKAKAKQRRKSK